jgi:hypothetical protein
VAARATGPNCRLYVQGYRWKPTVKPHPHPTLYELRKCYKSHLLYFGRVEGGTMSNPDSTWRTASTTIPEAVKELEELRQQNAIHAWGANVAGVTTTNFDYPEAGVTPGATITGRFIVASKATDNGNGTWNYEYAIQNVNSDRAAGSFSIDLPPGATITNIGFHDVPAHSGEPYDGTDWTATVNPYSIIWRTTPHSTNANANAIRWGTLYNFRFTADVAPVQGAAIVSLFKPAAAPFPGSILGTAAVPNPLVTCVADFNVDGGIDGSDIAAFYAAWELGIPAADVNADGGVDGGDAEYFFGIWETGSC